MAELTETPVVTCFLRHRGEVLVLRRSAEVGSYRGRWGAVAGHAEGDPDAAARREIAEETGLGEAVELIRCGEPFPVEDRELGKRWIVHPYLFDCASREVRLDWEATEAEWVAPPQILERRTVPDLWASYERVAPTVEAVAGDRERGSEALSITALEVLRDRAWHLGHRLAGGELDAGTALSEVRALVDRLLEARPAMAALANRVHRVMHEARGADEEVRVAAVARRAHDEIARAFEAEEEAARRAAEWVAGRRVLTLSRSGTVTAALLGADPLPEVLVAESRPGGEGVGVAEHLAAAGLAVTLLPDAAVGFALAHRDVDLVLVGADTVLAGGDLINKTGTYPAALAAARHGVPVRVATTRDKISSGESAPLEDADRCQVYAGDAELEVVAPLFELTPASLVTALVTEAGEIAPPAVREVSARLARLAAWRTG